MFGIGKKKAKSTSAGKGRVKRPKPSKRAIRIGLLAAVAVAAAYLGVLRPSQTQIDELEAQIDQVAQEQSSVNRRLEQHRTGQVYSPGQLSSVVSSIEALLPSAADPSANPGAGVTRIESFAQARGVTMTGLTIATAYVPAEGGLQKAEFGATMSGSLTALLGTISDIRSMPQLATVSSSGLSGDGSGTYTLPVTVTLWASNSPSWQTGTPGG